MCIFKYYWKRKIFGHCFVPLYMIIITTLDIVIAKLAFVTYVCQPEIVINVKVNKAKLFYSMITQLL